MSSVTFVVTSYVTSEMTSSLTFERTSMVTTVVSSQMPYPVTALLVTVNVNSQNATIWMSNTSSFPTVLLSSSERYIYMFEQSVETCIRSCIGEGHAFDLQMTDVHYVIYHLLALSCKQSCRSQQSKI